MQVDGVRLIEAHISKIANVPNFMRSYGAEDIPTPEQIRKWRTRGVPGGRLVDLLAYFEIEFGKPISLAPYIGENHD